ncbi:FMN-dependent NADH-azoreductase [Bacillus sp. JCM 19041]|uniref:FMN-dependent NADH-azoreductase n=1 Tax=Bacillus sp. JCM 19041 TaxID=1460637 RepID=UPI0006D0B2B2
MNVLAIKANNRPASQGVSANMYETFLNEIKTNENLNITEYDVFAEDTPFFGQDAFNAMGKQQSGEALTDLEERLVAAQAKAQKLVTDADLIVVAFPLWNLSIPAKLQTFMDYIYQAGFTFKYDAEGNMLQLKKDKKVILLNARGGMYSLPEMAQMDMSVNYMRNVFGGIFGMEIIDEVIIEGHNAQPEKASEIIANGLEQVKEVARKL